METGRGEISWDREGGMCAFKEGETGREGAGRQAGRDARGGRRQGRDVSKEGGR